MYLHTQRAITFTLEEAEVAAAAAVEVEVEAEVEAQVAPGVPALQALVSVVEVEAAVPA